MSDDSDAMDAAYINGVDSKLAIAEQKKADAKAARKDRDAKTARFKHRMEIIRTLSSVIGLTLNLLVMAHIYWPK